MPLSPQESVITGAIAEFIVPNIPSSQLPVVFGCAVCVCVCIQSPSRVQLFETPWTVAYQAPPSMEFSRQEYWTGLHFFPQGIFSPQESNPCLLYWQMEFFFTAPPGKPIFGLCSLAKSRHTQVPRLKHFPPAATLEEETEVGDAEWEGIS